MATRNSTEHIACRLYQASEVILKNNNCFWPQQAFHRKHSITI